MSSTARFKAELNQGTTYTLSIVPKVEDDDTPPNRTPLDLTGSTFAMKLRDDARLMSYPYPFRSLGKDGYPLEVQDGRVWVRLPAELTKQMIPHKRYFYTIDQTHPSGDVTRLLEGPISVRPS